MFSHTGEHDDEGDILHPDHPPEVFSGMLKRTLSCDESLVIYTQGGVYKVCVNVAVVFVCVSLGKSYFGMFD